MHIFSIEHSSVIISQTKNNKRLKYESLSIVVSKRKTTHTKNNDEFKL